MQAWGRHRSFSKLVPVQIPLGDLADIADIDDDNALRYERTKLNRMLERYDAKEAAIMIAEPGPEHKTLRISIYRTDRGRAEFVQKMTINANAEEGQNLLYDRAVTRANKALQKDWKRKNTFNEAQKQSYHLNMAITGLQQWLRAQNALKRLPGGSDLQILSLQPTNAEVTLNFRGSETRLRDTLSRLQFTLGQAAPDGSFELHIDREKNNSFYRPAGNRAPAFSRKTKQTF